MACMQFRAQRAMAGALLASTLVYATLYLRSGLGVWRMDSDDDPVTFAAENADTLLFETLLAQKDLEINSTRIMLDSVLEGRKLSFVDSAYELLFNKNRTSVKNSVYQASSKENSTLLWDGDVNSDVNSILNLNTVWLRPQMTLGRKKHQALLILGVPHTRRTHSSLLLDVLESLVDGMSEENKKMAVIVVQVSEPSDLKYYLDVCWMIKTRFPDHLSSGLIEVILPPRRYYPNSRALTLKWGDTPKEARSRIKKCLDYIFLMAYSVGRCKYYVQLEDDVSAIPGYSIALLDHAAKKKDAWLMMDFSALGFAGKMFHSSTIARLIHFIALFHEHKPVDVLLFNYIYVQECFSSVLVGESLVTENNCPELGRLLVKIQPALFRRVASLSSHDDKAQVGLDDEDYLGNKWLNRDPQVISHQNPSATVTTSLKQYQEFSLANCYKGSSVFWALNPQPDDFIMFSFANPTLVTRYRLLTGDERHPSDRAHDATVEVLPSSSAAASTTHSLEASDNYTIISRFNESVLIDETTFSLADGEVPANIGAILALRVAFHQSSQNWVMLKEIFIEVTK